MNANYSETVALATCLFDFAERNGLALFPLRADTKTPACENGFYDATTNRVDWASWRAQGHQLGISACLSHLILIDVDAHGDRNEAWAQFVAWCAEIGIDVPKPYCHSPGGGWHFAFRCPADFDPQKYRGFESIKVSHFRALAVGEEDGERISVRNRAYNVAPGSAFEGRPYLLAADAPPPIPYSEKSAPLFALLKRPDGNATTGPVPDAVDGVSHDGVHYDQLCWWIAKKVESWTNGAATLGNDEWISLGKRVKLSFPGEDGLNAFLAMSWVDQHETITRRWWNPTDFKTEGENLETLPALLKQDVTWMFRGVCGCPKPPICPVPYAIPDEIFEQHRREREQYQAALLGPLPNHPELPIEQAEALSDFWAHIPSGKIIHGPSRGLWNAGSVDKHLGRIKDAMKTEGPGMLASVFLSQHRPVQGMGWDPSQPMIVEGRMLTDNGWIRTAKCRTFNTYLPADIEHRAGDVAPFVDHVRFVYPDEWQHIINYLAFKVQHPGDKINHGLVFIGAPGIGKDTILEPAIAALGPHNFKSIGAASFFKSDFNGYLQSVMLRIDEVHDLGGESKYAFHDRTKTILAAPPMGHRINEKFVPEHFAVNINGVVLTSNHADALYLPRDDRRHYVCVSPREQNDIPDGHFDRLYEWFAKGGNETVAHYLANLDLSSFNAKAPPPKTAGWHMIVAAGIAPESGDMTDAIEAMGNPAVLTVAGIKQAIPGDSPLRAMLDDVKFRKAIPKRLADCGYVAVANPEASSGRWRMGIGKTSIYGRKDLPEIQRLDAARLLAASASTRPPIPGR